jgi:3-hydroxybutyryl-CoA dehydrogenase
MSGRRVAVFGAGAMGAGIAQVMAAASMEVVLLDIADRFVEAGLKRIEGRFAGDVKKGKISEEEKEHLMRLVKGSTCREEAAGADLVVEAVIEDLKTKGDLFETLNRLCGPDAIFATNTSTLSVTDLARLSGRAPRFVVLHFFNPVPAMRLVEVIPGLDTSAETVDAAVAMVKALKKKPVVVQDCPGFLVNRVLLMYIVEALLCAQQGVSPEEIDGQARKAGFPMGPLELVDMVGIDVSFHTQPVLHVAYGVRFPFPEIVRRLFEAGRLGAKAGRGIYAGGQVDDEFKGIAASLGAKRSDTPFSVDRCILRAVNEAVYCLQEGVATASEIDEAMVLGTGFPNEGGVGGPLHWADARGLDWVLSTLRALTESEGPRFFPHHLLKTYVAAGRLGRKMGKGFFVY